MNYICRDLQQATAGYQGPGNNFTSCFYIPYLFMRRILDYSVVGYTGFFPDFPATTINVSTVTVDSTGFATVTTSTPHGLPDNINVFISGVTGVTFGANAYQPIKVTGPSTFVLKAIPSGGTSGTGGTVTAGLMYASGLVSEGFGAGINFGTGVEREVSIPIEKRKVIGDDVGKLLVLKSTKYPTKNAGIFKISSINTGNGTTITAGSNGQSLPQSTINVASTTGFASSGTIFVTTSTGSYAVAYTGTTATTFTGCTGGSGVMSTGGVVSNLNRYIIDYRSTETPPPEAVNTINWWLYDSETNAATYVPTWILPSARSVTNATNTTPIQINLSDDIDGLLTGETVTISGVLGNTAANGTWPITMVNMTTTSASFTLDGSSGNGTYTSGGSCILDKYTGDGSAIMARYILQSPHSSGWQVRFCVERTFSRLPKISIATGFNGTSVGDFPVGGPQTHLSEYYDINPAWNTALLQNVQVGTGGRNTSIASRMTYIGNDRCVFFYTRMIGDTDNGMVIFGIPDNEPMPLSVDTERTFVYGPANNAVSDISPFFGATALRMGGGGLNVGTAFRNKTPTMAALTGWANLDGTSATNPMFNANAADSPYISGTELLPIEVWAGTVTDPGLSTNNVFPFVNRPEFMGTSPFLRLGRSNFGNYTLTTDETTTRNINAATNATPIKITTTVANALTTGQTVTISGVLGNTAANGTWTITVIDSTNFTLDNSAGNGTYTSGGIVNGCPRWIHLLNGIYMQWNGPGGITA